MDPWLDTVLTMGAGGVTHLSQLYCWWKGYMYFFYRVRYLPNVWVRVLVENQWLILMGPPRRVQWIR